MNCTLLNLTRRGLLLAAILAAAAPAMAQAPFPSKPVKLVVPYPAGGPIDVFARSFGEKLSQIWGQPVVIDNRAGANEILAADHTAKSPADGHTLLLGTDPSFMLNQFLFKKLPLNTFTDLTPITRVATVNMVFMVPASFPASTMKEFVAHVKGNPSKYNYASTGAGSTLHLNFDNFLHQENLQMTHVPYKGVAPALQDLLGGQVQALIAGSSTAIPHMESGKLKLLGINGAKRAKSLPNVPTFAEAGFRQTEMYFFMGLTGPKGLPKALSDKIASDVRKVLSDQAFVQKNMEVFGYEPVMETPEQFSEFLRTERPLADKKVRLANVSLD